jgi:hypothetical protein
MADRRDNLRPPWTPGESGNPAGRRAAGAYLSEHLAALMIEYQDGTPKYTRADLEAICEDPAAAPAKVIAARRVLGAMKDEGRFALDRRGKAHPAGTDPELGRDFDRIADRTEGKPIQSVRVEHVQDRPIAEIIADIQKLLAADPELAALLRESTDPDLAKLATDRDIIAELPPGEDDPGEGTEDGA